MRASEQRHRPANRIVDDPYAKLFLGPMLRAALATWEGNSRGLNAAAASKPDCASGEPPAR